MAEIVRCSVSTMRAPMALEDECEKECAEHRSTPPAVGASHGVSTNAAEADAAASPLRPLTGRADAATAAFSGSAGSTEVVLGSRIGGHRPTPGPPSSSFEVEGPRSEGQT